MGFIYLKYKGFCSYEFTANFEKYFFIQSLFELVNIFISLVCGGLVVFLFDLCFFLGSFSEMLCKRKILCIQCLACFGVFGYFFEVVEVVLCRTGFRRFFVLGSNFYVTHCRCHR